MNVFEGLNGPDPAERLRVLQSALAEGRVELDAPGEEVNNHVHTFYSFSPYSPSLAALKARTAGLQVVGSVDHDSIAAAGEMIEACRIIGMGGTSGFELRVNFTGTAVEGRKINNPDSRNLAYMVIHGVPEGARERVASFLAPIQHERNGRNRQQLARLNQELSGLDIGRIDFDRDVVALSRASEGGSITERHILFALAHRLIDTYGKGPGLTELLDKKLDLSLSDRVRAWLSDAENPHYAYDLLGALKSSFLPRFFVQPDEAECIAVSSAVQFARDIGAIPAYAYLGDVGQSPTGDKKAEQFEDEYLEELMDEIAAIGFTAVTYMPPRNTKEQLLRLQEECRKRELMEISGVDINSSRQSFNSPEVLEPEFRHLNESTWALVAHERAASRDPDYGLFSSRGPYKDKALSDRIAAYARLGREMDLQDPASTDKFLE